VRIGTSAEGLSLLLPLGYIVTVWLVRAVAGSIRRAPGSVETWFAAVAAGYVVFLFVGLVGVEVLSALDALRRVELALWWSAYIVLASVLSIWFWPHHRNDPRHRGPSWTSIAAASGFGLLASFLFWLGASTAPNNYDSMVYHLVRAANWANNGNVNNYLTYIPRQLFDGRLAEYFVTQTLVLDGNDHLVFVAQWMAFVVSVAMVAGLARQLGKGRRSGALWAVLLIGTLPLGIMQSTTTTNDVFVAAVGMSTFYLAAILWRIRRPDPIVLTLLGTGAGLAILTKLDAVLALIPLAVAAIVVAMRDHWSPKDVLRWGSIAVIVSVAVTLPMTLRNWETFHNITGQSSSEEATVSTAAPNLLLFNGIRNILNNADMLNRNLNKDILNFAATVGKPIGLRHRSRATNVVQPNLGVSGLWPQRPHTPSDEGSGSLVAFVALAIGAVALLSRSIRRRIVMHQLFPIAAASMGGLVLELLLLRWTTWGARYELISIFPALACAAAAIGAMKRVVAVIVGSLLVASSLILLPVSLFNNVNKRVTASYLNETRNLQMEEWCYFAGAPYTRAINEAIASGQHEIGYVTQYPLIGDVYPIWALLSQRLGGAHVEVVPVGVDNSTGVYTTPADRSPHVTLVLGLSQAGVEAAASHILRFGYRLQDSNWTQCEVIGTYVRG